MTDIAEQLDLMNPPYTGAGDWSRVVADAGVARRPLSPAGAARLRRGVRRAARGRRRVLAGRRIEPDRDRPRARGDRNRIRAPHRLRERPAARPGRSRDRRADGDPRPARGVVRAEQGPARDGDLRRRRAVRRRLPRRRDPRARNRGLREPRRRLPRGARVRRRTGRPARTSSRERPSTGSRSPTATRWRCRRRPTSRSTIRVTRAEMPLLNRILTYETLESGSAPAGGQKRHPRPDGRRPRSPARRSTSPTRRRSSDATRSGRAPTSTGSRSSSVQKLELPVRGRPGLGPEPQVRLARRCRTRRSSSRRRPPRA